MTKKEIHAYTAGIVDGEGCIMIHRPHGNFKYFNMRLEVAQKDGRILDFLVGNFGGTIRDSMNGDGVFKWQLCGERAAYLLKRLVPYLRFKRDQAELAVRFQINHLARKWHGEDELYRQLRLLKTRVRYPLAAETKRADPSLTGREAIVHPTTN